VCVCVASNSTKRNYHISVLCLFNTVVICVLHETQVRLDHFSEIRRFARLFAGDTKYMSVCLLNISNVHLNNIDIPSVKRNILKVKCCVCVCACVRARAP
jgi:hypothetical protein